MLNTRHLSLITIFIALSVVGAMIKIPAIIGSVALDIFPSLVAVVLIGNIPGMIVASIGHLISALLGGIPLGPLHILVAFEMALIVLIFNIFYRKNKKIFAVVIFVILNGIIAPLPFIMLFSLPFYIALVPSLIVGSILNVILGIIFIPKLVNLFKSFGGTYDEK